FLPPCAYKGTC
nr:RecName: Full=Riparin-1.2 [Crinia riparia]